MRWSLPLSPGVWRKRPEDRFAFPGSREGVRDILSLPLSECRCCPFFTFELGFPSPHESVWLTLRGGEGVKGVAAASRRWASRGRLSLPNKRPGVWIGPVGMDGVAGCFLSPVLATRKDVDHLRRGVLAGCTLVRYALEARCFGASPAYGWLAGAWPFGVIEGLWGTAGSRPAPSAGHRWLELREVSPGAHTRDQIIGSCNRLLAQCTPISASATRSPCPRTPQREPVRTMGWLWTRPEGQSPAATHAPASRHHRRVLPQIAQAARFRMLVSAYLYVAHPDPPPPPNPRLTETRQHGMTVVSPRSRLARRRRGGGPSDLSQPGDRALHQRGKRCAVGGGGRVTV